MNIVLVLIDSLNRHDLAAYELSSPVATPNLDAFARRAWRFDNHFVGSLACIPARRELFTGFKEMMWRPWGPLEPFDARLPALLQDQGYTTGLVTDHYHYWEEPGNGYLQSFQSVDMIRGHEFDLWRQPVPTDAPVPRWVENIEKWRPGQGRWYYANVKEFQREEDFFPAKVFSGAVRWLRENPRKEPFFLQVESFDSHEPFHVPEPYASKYGTGADRDRFNLWPPYQDRARQEAFFAEMTDEELAFIRSQYLGKVAMVDRWFGDLLTEFDRSNLWDDTMIIVTTDHGHDFAEHGAFAKAYPNYDTHANIPLFIWHPAFPGNGQTIAGLTTTVDLFATVLDAAGAAVPSRTHSRSLMPLLREREANVHDALIYGMFGQGVCWTDGEWTLFKSPERDGPLYSYSSLLYQSLSSPPGTAPPIPKPVGSGYFIPGVDLPQWQVPRKSRPNTRENFLFHRSEDPGQTRNLWDAEAAQRQRMLDQLIGMLRQEGCPPEQYTRLGLDADA
ncbi:MAG: sulfatase [Chloroflexia bacterium]|nr:sulfatase [Chloroflexia bacterium]